MNQLNLEELLVQNVKTPADAKTIKRVYTSVKFRIVEEDKDIGNTFQGALAKTAKKLPALSIGEYCNIFDQLLELGYIVKEGELYHRIARGKIESQQA